MQKNSKLLLLNLGIIIVCAVFGVSNYAHAAVGLTISPPSQNIQNGQTFSVDINLDTGSDSVDGVDIFYLRYNPNILQVQDSDLSLAGVQITPGNILPLTLINTANNGNGTVQFSQVSSGGNTYKGSGRLATVTFRAIANGNSNISIDFSQGGTSDSNVAGGGAEKLNSVSGASVTVAAPVVVSPVPIIAITLGSLTINSGDSSTLSWSSSNSTACTATDGWSGAKATTGSLTVSPIKDTTYTLTCTGPGGSDTKSVTLSVALPGGMPAVSLSVKPSTITVGAPVTITWSSINATACTASRGWSGTQSLSGSAVVYPTANTTYNLKCTGVNGNKSASDSVKVNPVVSNVITPNPVTPVYNPPIAPTPSDTNYVLTQPLYRGLSGAQVTTLQNVLIKLGYNIGGSATGYFGPMTQSAVRTFQSSKGIVSSGPSYGLVGPATRTALLTAVSSGASSSIQSPIIYTPVSPSSPTKPAASNTNTTSGPLTQTLYRGLTSPQVTVLQNMLIKLGYSIGGPATGYFGVRTEDAVKAFQRSEGIASYYGNSINTGYGIVGPATRSALVKATSGR